MIIGRDVLNECRSRNFWLIFYLRIDNFFKFIAELYFQKLNSNHWIRYLIYNFKYTFMKIK